jgi:hypothetical protein
MYTGGFAGGETRLFGGLLEALPEPDYEWLMIDSTFISFL